MKYKNFNGFTEYACFRNMKTTQILCLKLLHHIFSARPFATDFSEIYSPPPNPEILLVNNSTCQFSRCFIQ